jgi:hypothetical protein
VSTLRVEEGGAAVLELQHEWLVNEILTSLCAVRRRLTPLAGVPGAPLSTVQAADFPPVALSLAPLLLDVFERASQRSFRVV